MKLKLLVLAFGLLFFSCAEKEKECPDCGEHGICNETTKTCDCASGYIGLNCEFEKAPNGMRILGLTIKKHPALNNGVTWDAFSSYADPYWIIYDGNGNQVFKSSYKEEVPPSNPVTWSTSIDVAPILFYKIVVYDYDSGSSDSQMASFLFTPYVTGFNFPIIKELQQGNTVIELYYSYQF